MTVSDLLAYLRSRGIDVRAEDGELRIPIATDELPPDVRKALADHRKELLVLLGGVRAPRARPPAAFERFAGGGPRPLSYAQEGLWFLHQLQPEGCSYNVPLSLRLRGPLDVGTLERALRALVERHETLRTTFTSQEGTPMQQVGEAPRELLRVEDLSGLGGEQREQEAEARAEQEFQRPFDLTRGPLVRVVLMRLAEEEHLLVVTMHHLICDGWSLGVFGRELGMLYQGMRGGEAPRLEGLPIQYGDFALWQRQWLRGEVRAQQLGYWKEKLAGLPTLQLPLDHPRPTVATYRGAAWSLKLSEELWRGLTEVSRAEGATLFMTMLSAFMVLLHRYTGQEDVVVGSPIANRNRWETEGLIGVFVNMLVMRVGLTGEMSFREVLGRVRETALEAYAHQDLPFEKLVEELDPPREPGRNPLFQVAFAAQNAPDAIPPIDGLTVRSDPADNHTTRFDLEAYMWETPSGPELRALYAVDLFEASSIERLFESYQRILAGIVEDPRRKVRELSILGEKERRLLVEQWSGRRREYPREATVAELFEQQAARRPEAVALEHGGRLLSYGELNERANRVAHYLRERGVGPEVLVGVCLPRSLELVVGLLGVLKAGGAYLPMDPEYPVGRLAFMREDSGAGMVVSQRSLRGRLEGNTVICLDEEAGEIGRCSGENPKAGAGPENLVYVIYTSGSTGRPKGVMLEHRGLTNLAAWHARAFQVTQDDRATLLAALSFDASAWELWPYLAAGATVVIPETQVLEAPAVLKEWIAAVAATICFLPTPVAELLVEEEMPPGLALRIMLTGGDRLHRSPAKRLPFTLVNNYGPTENSVVSTWASVETARDAGAPPIGRPVDNVRVYLLDASGAPVPVGVTGELYIGGDGLARGYLHRPELSAERFVADPFSGQSGARLYRTGDMARWSADGNLHFVGRVDDQVKIRGCRIELGEVETVLCERPGVHGAAVVARDEGEGTHMVAYVGLRPGSTADSDELREWMRERVPAYMVPSRFVIVEELPMSSSGKVDKRSLPAVTEIAADPGAGDRGPRTETESLIAGIWADALGREDVGMERNFFDLGGHSLLMVRVHARICRALGRQVPIVDLFQYPTVGSLSRHLSGQAVPTPRETSRERARKQKEALGRLGRARAASRMTPGASEMTPGAPQVAPGTTRRGP